MIFLGIAFAVIGGILREAWAWQLGIILIVVGVVMDLLVGVRVY